MREKTRQSKLAAGEAITLRGAVAMVTGAHSRSWSGCLSGCDWCGQRVYFAGQLLSGGEHQQNNAPTGWERRGLRSWQSMPITDRREQWEAERDRWAKYYGSTEEGARKADEIVPWLRRGITLRVVTRNPVGRNLDGDTIYKTTGDRKVLVV